MACGIRSAIVLCMLIVSVATVPLEDFYSFGSEHGDDVLSANDDGSTEEIQLSVSFPFFDRDHNSLFVSKAIIIMSSYSDMSCSKLLVVY